MDGRLAPRKPLSFFIEAATRAHSDIPRVLNGQEPRMSLGDNYDAFVAMHSADIEESVARRIRSVLFEHREVLKGNLPLPVEPIRYAEELS